MKLSDYVIKFLVEQGITELFTVSGGGIAHLLDSLGRSPAIRYTCNYHEQAAAVAAEGYARTTGGVGVCLVTVGPGAINALSGILGAWYDSVPLLVLSGQVRSDLIADFSKVRQRGPQESNVIAMATPVTKSAVSLRDPGRIRYELGKALHFASAGRPGPVWIEIPFDVQGASINEADLEAFQPEEDKDLLKGEALRDAVAHALASLRNARRPLLVGGNGIHLSRAEPLLRALLERVQVPFVTPDAAKDLLPEAHPQCLGIYGTAGQRRANFAVQNSDCLLCLGVGLSLKKIGFNYQGFAPRARKIVVEIDRGQLFDQVIQPDVPIHADVRVFLEEGLRQLGDDTIIAQRKWRDACSRWKERYPLLVQDCFADPTHVNSYVFVDRLSAACKAEEVIIGGSGLDTVSCLQGLKVQEGQRFFTSINWGAMGWDLPLAIGACVANQRRKTICVTGDGSVQMNIQELMTISQQRLPIKIFIFNNAGYASIRATQNSLFEGRIVASDPKSGVGNPDFEKLAAAYGIPHSRLRTNDEVEDGLRSVLADDGPALCEVVIAPEQGISPKASAFRREDGSFESRPLEDMAPFLPREEIWENMHQFDDEQQNEAASMLAELPAR